MASLPDIVISTPTWLALLTTGVGALEGAIIARSSPARERIDIVGMAVFALFLGLGGGMVRDTMVGNLPFESIRTPSYVITVGFCILVVLFAGKWVKVNSLPFVILDALTLGLYAAIGTQTALDFQIPWGAAILVGLFASLSGGAIVSVLRGQRPNVLVPGSPYGLVALLGVLVYLPLTLVNGGLASLVTVGVVIVARLAVVRWHVETPAVKPLEVG